MSLTKDGSVAVTILQAIIFIQFGLCVAITILTTVGISFGYPVASHYLMALLQALVAIPGIVYIVTQTNIWVAVYISFQVVTAACEVYWLVYLIFDNQPAGSWIALAIITAVNILAAVVGVWFRKTALNLPCLDKKTKKAGDAKKEKPKMKAPSTSMSDIEKSKSRAASKSNSSSSIKSIKKSPTEKSENTDRSSKGSLKIRKNKNSKSVSMPLDSRETTSITFKTSNVSED